MLEPARLVARARSRISSATFDARDYLERHPDVRAAIERGDFRDALHHYRSFGRLEHRAHRRALPGAPRVGVTLGLAVPRRSTAAAAWAHRLGALIEWADPGQVAARIRADAEVDVEPGGLESVLGGSSPFFASGRPRLSVPLRWISRRPGHAILRFRVDAQVERGFARLLIDYGDGAEPEAVAVPFFSGRRVRRLVRFERAPVAAWLELPGYTGHFRIASLALRPVRERFAASRVRRRLVHHHPSYLGRDEATITRELGAGDGVVTDAMWKAYGSTFRRSTDTVDYAAWRAAVEAPHLARLDAEAPARVRALRHHPTVSVLVPVHDPTAEHLEACLRSILDQSYPHLELCVADDASTAPHVRPLLERFAREDPRVRLHLRAAHGHISLTSNDALAMASGELVALVDHDDVLPRHALLMAIEAVAEQPQAVVVYGDEDKLDLDGGRKLPHFKPEWNPELLLSQNYIGHLVVMRTERVRAVGGFRVGYEGSQDHDLLLRVTEGLSARQIVHVPWILYHWRESQGSTAMTSTAKGYTGSAGQRAVQDAVARLGLSAEVLPHPATPHAYRVRWGRRDSSPLVSLIVPTRDGGDKLETAIDSILQKTRYAPFELLVLDNGSVEARTLRYLSRIGSDPRVRVLRYDHPFNFSAINNFGVARARGAVVGLVNDDVEVIDGDWLSEMVGWAARPEIGCVGAKLLYPDRRVQHAGVIIGLGGVAGHSHKYLPEGHPGYFHRPHLTQAASAVTGACLVVEKRIYVEAGGLDEETFAIAFNDVDFCLRVRGLGYRNVYAPFARLLHHESATRGAEDTPEKLARFSREIAAMKARWGEALALDPYYSPHLTLDREDFSLGVRR